MSASIVADLFAPVSTEEFLHRYWEKEILFVPRDEPARFAKTLTLSDLDRYITRSDLRHPAIRLVEAGRQIGTRSYTTSLSLGKYRTDELICSDKVLELYRQGATILVQLAHLSLPTLRPLAAALEAFWGFNIEMNVYLTPPGRQGFAPHFDTHSVCVLQLSGEKSWNLHGRRLQRPLLNEPFAQGKDDPGPIEQSATLKPGSLLYIPRGQYHSAHAHDSPSLHLTIGFFPPTWLDIFHEHVMSMAESSDFRRAPTLSELDQAPRLLRSFAETFDAKRAREALARRLYSSESQPADGRLLDLLDVDLIDESTVLRLRTEANIQVTRGPEGISLSCYNARVQFPSMAVVAIEAVLARYSTFTPSDLIDSLDQESALVLCRRLLREGLITIVRRCQFGA